MVAVLLLAGLTIAVWICQSRFWSTQSSQSIRGSSEDELQARETVLKHELHAAPDNNAVRKQLAAILWQQFKLDQAADVLKELPVDEFDLTSLLIFSGADSIEALMSQTSTGGATSTAQLLQAQRLLLEHNPRQASDLLKAFLHTDSDHLTAQGWYGLTLAQRHSPEFRIWNRQLPAEAEQHSTIWVARAAALLENDSLPEALDCVFRAFDINPVNGDAIDLLSRAVSSSMTESIPNEIISYAQQLKRRKILLAELSLSPHCKSIEEISTLFKETGLPLHAEAWQAFALQGGCSETTDRSVKVLAAGQNDSSSIIQAFRRESGKNLSHLKSQNYWEQFRFAPHQPAQGVRPRIVLQDRAAVVGIQMRYDNGSPPELPLSHLFETTGGGVAVLDYDMDGYEDLFLPQGGDWRTPESNQQAADSLFRNLSATDSQDVATVAGVDARVFAQGATTGDFNSDGFPDLFVCHLGNNRLYENQGDGTFVEVFNTEATARSDWSVSAGFADLNGDGLSDLYVVNYLDRIAVESSPCETPSGQHGCPPRMFPGVSDELLINRGDGNFHRLSPASGISNHTGKGMGLVIAKFAPGPDLQILVGNDGEPNFLFSPAAAGKSSVISYQERGALLGLDGDSRGHPQASMGIAAGDLNHDGRLDAFVTNFYEESNTLYLQQQDSTFLDETSTHGNLQGESRFTLGFGTQFFDADLDGDLDLLIANGHVDRSDVTGEPDRMPPSLYENLDSGQMQLVQFPYVTLPEQDYFSESMLGRAVAKLDWNRDGKPDLAVTHLDRPFSLLLNQTHPVGNRIGIRLVSRTGEREAIGTQVSVRCGQQTWTQQLVSGDGFEVANSQQLIFGVNDQTSIEELIVNWRSGKEERYTGIQIGRCYLCIEGTAELLPLYEFEP